MISIRAARENDIPRILEIAGESITPAWTHEYVKESLDRDDVLILVAVEHSVAGFAAYRQVGDDGELLQIAVDAGRRRSGFGSRLIGAVLERAFEDAANSVFLEVRESNDAAIGLYKKHGFEELRIRKNYYDSPTENALVMVKKVNT